MDTFLCNHKAIIIFNKINNNSLVSSNIQSMIKFPQLSQKSLVIVGVFQSWSKQGPHITFSYYVSNLSLFSSYVIDFVQKPGQLSCITLHILDLSDSLRYHLTCFSLPLFPVNCKLVLKPWLDSVSSFWQEYFIGRTVYFKLHLIEMLTELIVPFLMIFSVILFLSLFMKVHKFNKYWIRYEPGIFPDLDIKK